MSREKCLEFSPEIKREATKTGRCGLCHEEDRLSVHHIIPLSFAKRLRKMKVSRETIEGYREWIRSKHNALGACRWCHIVLDEQAKIGIYYGLERIGFQPE